VNVLFVVPTERRLQALVDAVAADTERRRHARDNWFTPSWPLLVALTDELAAHGPLGCIWRSLRDPLQRLRLLELTARTELAPIEPARCLGRAWRKEQPDFWQTLSPLGVPIRRSSPTVDATDPEQPHVPVPETPSQLERMREQLVAEARLDAQTATVGAPTAADWTSSRIDGLMLDPDEEPALEEWR
jgi:hypothetical protein